MTIFHSKYVSGPYRVPAAECAGEVVAVRYAFTIPAGMAESDILELGVLPAYHRVVDAVADFEDIDDSTGTTFDIGLMTGGAGTVGEDTTDGSTPRTCGDELYDGINTGVAGGVVRMSERDGFRITPVAYDRSIGVKLATTSGNLDTDSECGLTVFYGT